VWGAMLEEFNKLNPKPQTTAELKVALQAIWNNLPDETICCELSQSTHGMQ